MTKICCVCNKIQCREAWVAAEVFAGEEQLSHGYCPACYDDVLEDIRLFLHKRVTEKTVAHPVQMPVFAGACA